VDRVYWTDRTSFSIEEGLERFFTDALNQGYRSYRDGDFSGAFGVSDGSARQVDFVHRGRGRRGWVGPLLEVLLGDAETTIRLGPRFGLEETACVVVNGYEAARQVCNRWLGGADVIRVTDFLNRRDLSPLKLAV
jgi:hypothetical protein